MERTPGMYMDKSVKLMLKQYRTELLLNDHSLSSNNMLSSNQINYIIFENEV